MTVTLPAPVAAGPDRVPRLRPVRYEPGPKDAGPAAPQAPARPPVPSPSRDLADDGAAQRAHHVLRLALEVLDGRRSITHLAEHVGPSALRYLRAALPRGSGPSRLTSLRVCRPRPGAAEVAAVYRVDGRARALAARFEQVGDGRVGWRCVTLRLG